MYMYEVNNNYNNDLILTLIVYRMCLPLEQLKGLLTVIKSTSVSTKTNIHLL